MPSEISSDAARRAAIIAIADLLTRLRTDFAFVGAVARSAWLSEPFNNGSVDVLVTLTPEGRTQIPVMASHRGFLVDQEEVEAAMELDLVPLRWPAEGEDVRIHALIASNALYGTMVRAAVETTVGELPVRVVTAEDLALLATLAEDESLRHPLISDTAFDRPAFNQKLRSIGLSGRVVAE